MTRYLRSKLNGIIFEWNERLAANPNAEEVTEQEAYPERFAPVDLAKRKPTVNLKINVETTAPNIASPELLAEASRPFDTPKATRVIRKTAAPTETIGLSFGEI